MSSPKGYMEVQVPRHKEKSFGFVCDTLAQRYSRFFQLQWELKVLFIFLCYQGVRM